MSEARHDNATPFGELLRRYRRAAGLTQEELAERARMSARAVSDLERGLARTPHKETVQLLAEALQLSPQDRAVLGAARRGDDAAPRAGASGQPSASTPPLVGRSFELALLERHLAGEGPPVLLFVGEPGIGKSRLLRESMRRAASHGLRALADGCLRRGGQESFAPLAGAIQRCLAGRTPAQSRADLRGCAWLVRLLPELAAGPIEPLPAWALPHEQERRLLFAAVERLLANVAGAAGTLLVLDDLQWAGVDALDLLATLARSPTAPVRVVGAYRDTEVPPAAPLAVTLADLAHAGLAAQRTLAPLGAREVDELLDGLLGAADGDAAVREQLRERAGGVPFFVVSCAQALHLAGASGAPAGAVPWDVAQSVRQRVAALPEGAGAALGVAAVAGRTVQPEILLAAADQPEGAVLAALDAACRARLLLQEAGVYHFAHDLIREVVEADLGAARRLVLHRRVAAALERAGREPPVELVAYHYRRSDLPGKAAPFLERAGDRARAQTAPAAAVAHYQELVDLLDELGHDREAARVREKLGAVLDTLHRADAALAVLDRAAATYAAAGEREGVLRATAQIGWVHATRGTVAAGLARLQPILSTASPEDASPGLAALYLSLASLCQQGARYTECLAASGQAARVAQTAGDRWTLARSRIEQASALDMLGRTAEAMPLRAEGLRLAEATGDLTYLCIALDQHAEGHLRGGEFEASGRYIARILDINAQLGSPLFGAYILGIRGLLAFCAGDWDLARADIERSVAEFPQRSHMRAYPLSALGWLRLAEGNWDEAARSLREAIAAAEPSGDLQALRWAGRPLAEHCLLDCRPAEALARIEPLLDRDGMHETDVTPLLPLLAWAHLALGDSDRAGIVALAALQRARAQHHRLALADALRVHALVAIHRRRWAEAEASIEEGVALTRRMPYPYAEARLLQVYGALHDQRREAGLARERRAAALAIFRRLGARKDIEQTGQLPASP